MTDAAGHPAPLSWSPPPVLVEDLRRILGAVDGPDVEQRFEAAAWAGLLTAVGPALLTRGPTLAHVTASAVVLSTDGTQTCLVLHGRFRRWVQPGGHLEPGDVSVVGAAAREVLEETGLEGVVLPDVTLSRHLAPCRPDVGYHLDVRFVLVADPLPPTVSDESGDVRWWPVDGPIPDLVDDGAASIAFALGAHRAWRARGGDAG